MENRALNALRTVNAPSFTYDMLLGSNSEYLEDIQEYIDDGLTDDIDCPSSPVIVEELKRFLDKYMVLFAKSWEHRKETRECGIELDLRCISCHGELTSYYIQQFKDKFDIMDYFCIFSDGIEDELFLAEAMKL